MQMTGQLLRAALGILHRLDQNGNRFLSRRQRDGSKGGASDALLAGGQRRVGGEIDVVTLVFFALQGRMFVELPEKGTGVQAQALAQLGGGEPAGGLADQRHDGLRQMAVAGKADIPMKPKPVLIESRQFGQGVKAAIVIKAGQGAPKFETPPEGAERSAELFHEFGQGDHFFSPPAPEQRGSRILDGFHDEGEISDSGTLYDNGLKLHIVCQTEAKPGKEKANDFAKIKSRTHPNRIAQRHILGHLLFKIL